jgi:hypothetical protein
VSHGLQRVQQHGKGRKTYVAVGFAAAVDLFLTLDGLLCLAATAAALGAVAKARCWTGRASARPLRAREVWRSMVVCVEGSGEVPKEDLQQKTQKEKGKPERDRSSCYRGSARQR